MQVFAPSLALSLESEWQQVPQVSRTLLSVLADRNNIVVLIVSARYLIFNSSSPFTEPLEIIPTAPIAVGITVTLMLNNFIIIIIIIIIVIYSWRVFHIIVSWWSFTKVWVTASLPKSSGLFSVFWPFSIIT